MTDSVRSQQNAASLPNDSTYRRMSVTQRMFGNAKDWFTGNNNQTLKDTIRDFDNNVSSSSSSTSSNDSGNSGIGDGFRQRSKSLGFFCEKRDMIIPGPVF